MEEKESDKPKGDSKSGVSDDFKVSLQALVSESDFQTLSEQFMSKKLLGGEEKGNCLFKLNNSYFLTPIYLFLSIMNFSVMTIKAVTNMMVLTCLAIFCLTAVSSRSFFNMTSHRSTTDDTSI